MGPLCLIIFSYYMIENFFSEAIVFYLGSKLSLGTLKRKTFSKFRRSVNDITSPKNCVFKLNFTKEDYF